MSGEMARLQRQIDRIGAEPTEDEVWKEVELARHEERPYTLDYVERMFEDFIELHGDRGLSDDKAIVSGLGRFDGRRDAAQCSLSRLGDLQLAGATIAAGGVAHQQAFLRETIDHAGDGGSVIGDQAGQSDLIDPGVDFDGCQRRV